MTLHEIVFTCLVGSILAGCGGGPTPRLIDLVGEEAFSHRELSPAKDKGWQLAKAGLVVHSDDTAQNAAPAIIAEYLETLTRRTEEFLRQHCSFREIVILPPLTQPVRLSQEMKVQAQRLQVPYEIVVVLSSREKAGPEKIGEATMMTQMGGTLIQNSAMAEIGIFRVADFKMVFLAQESGTESLEQLDVPIGSNQPSSADARAILRARAGQNALDRALNHLGSACQSGT